MELLDDKPCKHCKEIFTPKVDWQKFCHDDCHDAYWKEEYRKKAAVEKRLDRVEKELGIK